VYCDLTTTGGPWLFLYSYNHIAFENNPLVGDTIPLSPTNGYSHTNLNKFKDQYGNSVFTANKVRFYCQTSAHNRKIHFYTSNTVVGLMAYDGSNKNNLVSFWTNNFTALSDHTGFLPAQATFASASANIGLRDLPFYKKSYYHWAIRGSGTRFNCDDASGNFSRTTLHQIWVNTGIVIKLCV
jgi:hypothetical protein